MWWRASSKLIIICHQKIMLVILIVVISTLGIGTSLEPGCRPWGDSPVEKVIPFRDTCYVIFAESLKLNWDEAKTYCEDRGGILAKILNDETDVHLSQVLPHNEQFWIGLSRQKKEDGNGYAWVYTDGEESKFNLLYKPPNYMESTVIQAIFIEVWTDLQTSPWDTGQTSEEKRFICQYNKQPTVRSSPMTVTVPKQPPVTDVDRPAGTTPSVAVGQEETTDVDRPVGTTPSGAVGQEETTASIKKDETSRQFIWEKKVSGPVSRQPDVSVPTKVNLRCIEACLRRSSCVATSMSKQTGSCNLYLTKDILLSALHSDDSERFLFYFVQSAF